MGYKRKILEKMKSRRRVSKGVGRYKVESRHVFSQCLNKLSYATYRDAERMAGRKDIPLRIYECPFCKFYHLTRKSYVPKRK